MKSKAVALLLLYVFTNCLCETVPKEGNNPNRYVYDTYGLLAKPYPMQEHSTFHVPLLARQFFFPWMLISKLLKEEGTIENSEVISDPNTFQIQLNVKNFKPEELKVKVSGRAIIVEGHHTDHVGEKKTYMANQFAQRYEIPPGVLTEEITSQMFENGTLLITAPKHPVPSLPPEREIPIIFKEKSEKQSEIENRSKLPTILTTGEYINKRLHFEDKDASTLSPLESQEHIEATTHGKIKKKELKMGPKEFKREPPKKTEVNTVLDYTLMDGE